MSASAMYVAVGAVVAAAVGRACRPLQISGWRRALAASAGGVLLAVVCSEYAVRGGGGSWADHPSTGAAVTGLLLLALTVLAVETALARSLEDAEERRWSLAAEHAAMALLSDAAVLARMLREVTERLTRGFDEGFELADVQSQAPTPERVRELQSRIEELLEAYGQADIQLRAAVLAGAPVLTATDRLHALYDDALAASAASNSLAATAREFRERLREHARVVVRGDPPRMSFSEGDRLAWWGVVGSWMLAEQALATFDLSVNQRIQATLDETDAPWETPLPQVIRDGLRYNEREYGGARDHEAEERPASHAGQPASDAAH